MAIEAPTPSLGLPINIHENINGYKWVNLV